MSEDLASLPEPLDGLPELISLVGVARRGSVSTFTAWHWAADEVDFPAPVATVNGNRVWLPDEVQAWLDVKPRKKRDVRGRLDDDLRHEIRRRASAGETSTKIAVDLGIGKSTAYNIARDIYRSRSAQRAPYW
jgi:predicted DNA-binding transcriptional regulator AlpA